MDARYLSEFASEMTADEVVGTNVREYGHHTLLTKIIDMTDGLKPIHRHVLWVIHKEEKARKVSSIAGVVMEKYHPTGDQSICDAITRLTQPFANMIPMVQSTSNVGAYGGGDAAKARYLPVRSHPFTRDIYFNGVDAGTYNYITSETGEGLVPEYFIPKLPMALFTGYFGIAIGYRSKPIRLTFGGMCSMVQKYAELRKIHGMVPKQILREELAQYLLPDFPTAGLLRNKAELMGHYINGEYDKRVITDGILHLTPSTITIKTLPPDIAPVDVYERLRSLRANRDPFMDGNFQEILDASGGRMEACIECTLKRGVNPFDVLDEFKKLIGFSKSWTPISLMVAKDRSSKHTTPIEVLTEWYKERSRSIMAELKLSQGRYNEKIRQLKALLIISDHCDEVYQIFKAAAHKRDTVLPLCKRFGLTQYQALFLAKLTFGQITGRGKQDLQDELVEVETKIKALQTRFVSIDQTIYDDAERLYVKYKEETVRRCCTPTYMGAVKLFGKGYIQYQTMKELFGIVTRFGDENLELSIYPAGQKNKLVVNDGLVETEDALVHPKEFVASDFTVSRLKPKYSIGLRKDTIYRVKGLHAKTDNDLKFYYVNDAFTTINHIGIVEQVQSTSIKPRQAVIAHGIQTKIKYISPVACDEVVVVHCNTHKGGQNTVWIDRIKADGSKLAKMPLGKIRVLGVFRPDESFQFTVPEEFMSRCRIRHFHIDGKALGNGSLKLELNRKMCNDGRKIVPLQKGVRIFTVK